MEDKTFCHEARSSRAIRAAGGWVGGGRRICLDGGNVSSMLVADGGFLSPVDQSRPTPTVAVRKTRLSSTTVIRNVSRFEGEFYFLGKSWKKHVLKQPDSIGKSQDRSNIVSVSSFYAEVIQS